MTASAQSRTSAIVTWILRVILGIAFLIIGGSKVSGTLHTVEFFAAIGWGQWFRYLTGTLDIVAAFLLFMPRLTYVGALMLVCTVGSATIICVALLHTNPAVPLTLALLAAALAWLTLPRRSR